MRRVRLVAYEHDRLEVGRCYPDGGARFEAPHFEALARYHDRSGTPAFHLGHRAVQLCGHVGFLRVGPVSLEVYPKLGRSGPPRDWPKLLLHMLDVAKDLRLTTHAQSPLGPRPGELFDVLLRRLLDLTDAILREGPVRMYREIEENGTALRGRLLPGPHVRENHTHRERMYVAYEVLDTDNLPNRILRRAVERIGRIAASSDLVHRAEEALGRLPEVAPGPIREAEWSKLRFDRRTERYREALTLARLLLLDERPDLHWGEREVLALTFDMNVLFEEYVARALSGVAGVRVRAQRPGRFWKREAGDTTWARPDLLVYTPDDPRPIVLDTKWKVPRHGRPDDADLRQVFAYLHTFGGRRGALVYPRASPTQDDAVGVFAAGGLRGDLLYVDLFTGDRPDLRGFRERLGRAIGLDQREAA